MIGDVINRKIGVSATMGSVKDRGESFIAFMNNREVIVLRDDVAKTAIQNV